MRIIAFILITFIVLSVPCFAEVSIDLGGSLLANAVAPVYRPLGGYVAIGVFLFETRALIQVTGGVFPPPLSDNYNDPAATVSAGVLVSPMKPIYFGFRTGLLSPIEDDINWYNYGSMVIRVQNTAKGLHFFAETEINFTGIFNRFTAGVDLIM